MTVKRTILSLVSACLIATSARAQTSLCDSVVVVNVPASIGIVEIVPATSGQTVRVCGFALNAGAGISSVAGTNPAAGLEISETVPTNAKWKLLSFRFSLVASATVATRSVRLTLDDGTNVFGSSDASLTQTASQTFAYTFGPSLTPANNATSFGQTVGTPQDVILPAGYRIKTVTLAIQAGDDYSAPQYLVQDFSVFQFVTGTGTNCGTGTANASGVYEVQPNSTVTVAAVHSIVKGAPASAFCISNLRPTTITGTLSYSSR